MSQLTGVIFLTIILLLQGAEEMFPLQQEQWKAGADKSSQLSCCMVLLPAAENKNAPNTEHCIALKYSIIHLLGFLV